MTVKDIAYSLYLPILKRQIFQNIYFLAQTFAQNDDRIINFLCVGPKKN